MSKQERIFVENPTPRKPERQITERRTRENNELITFYTKDVPRFIPQLPCLPEKYRIGEYDDTITLYRGDSFDKLSEDIMTTATEEELMSFYHKIDYAVRTGRDDLLDLIVSAHTTYAHKNGTATPFVSASPFRGFSQHFVPDHKGGIATVEVPANRIIAVRSDCLAEGGLPEEVLIFGGVLKEEIIDVSPAIPIRRTTKQRIPSAVSELLKKVQKLPHSESRLPIDFPHKKQVI